jgi:Rieske Fe-S protein
LSQHDNETPHLPPPSIWPFGFAVGVACLLTGLVVSPIVAVIGAIIALVFGLLWIRDVTRPVRAPAAPVEPERRVAIASPDLDEEDEAHGTTRSTFLSVATLGLGGVIGGLVTVPALGFAVLPSFTNVEDPNPELGPIEEFPENEWVIATYMENEGIGEVSRRTMYIRNNGRAENDQPSFTIIYSRCAHLGCPVQPNGPIFDDRKKELENGVSLTPAQPVGFGCPCHGGQYDTEGNRTAGPPVRALDRAEFSIREGKLFLGDFYSVAEVEGSGARARIKRYGRMPPGVHVDGWSAWLYPLEVPK